MLILYSVITVECPLHWSVEILWSLTIYETDGPGGGGLESWNRKQQQILLHFIIIDIHVHVNIYKYVKQKNLMTLS